DGFDWRGLRMQSVIRVNYKVEHWSSGLLWCRNFRKTTGESQQTRLWSLETCGTVGSLMIFVAMSRRTFYAKSGCGDEPYPDASPPRRAGAGKKSPARSSDEKRLSRRQREL